MAASVDCQVGDVSAIVARHARVAGSRSRPIACWHAARDSGWRPKRFATSRWRRAACLNETVGGPRVYPPRRSSCSCRRPAMGRRSGKRTTGDDRYRRAIYTFRFRSVPYPVLTTFDAPNGEFACVRRSRSNTPLQALATLNEPLFMECARALALKTLQEGGPDAMKPTTRLCLPPLHGQAARCERIEGAASPAGQSSLSDLRQPRRSPGNWLPTMPPIRRLCPTAAPPAQLAAWTAVSPGVAKSG